MRQKKYLLILALTIATTLAQPCPNHQYLDPQSNQCVYCDISCSNCIGSATNCSGCSTGYFQNGSTCTHCPGECTSCLSLTECTSCRISYYLSNSTCLSCGVNCMLCNNSQCVHCHTGYKIQDNCTSCAGQFYYDSAKSACDMCPMGCLDCTGKVACSSC